ncbi:MAG: hypothetical protein QW171_02860 [Candidatus Bilamarchaeaceae archaeon]
MIFSLDLNSDIVILSGFLFVVSFIIWEFPRSIRIMDEEYTKGIYSESGRLIDFAILMLGLLTALFFFSNTESVLGVFKTPAYAFPFSLVFLAVPTIILLGYLKRAAERIDRQQSVTLFFIHSFLDLAHTVFFITFSIIFVPFILYILVGGRI